MHHVRIAITGVEIALSAEIMARAISLKRCSPCAAPTRMNGKVAGHDPGVDLYLVRAASNEIRTFSDPTDLRPESPSAARSIIHRASCAPRNVSAVSTPSPASRSHVRAVARKIHMTATCARRIANSSRKSSIVSSVISDCVG